MKKSFLIIAALTMLVSCGGSASAPKEDEAGCNPHPSQIVSDTVQVDMEISQGLPSENSEAGAVIENHSGTDAANVAHIIAGSLTAYEQGNYEEAIAIFEEYDGDDDIIAPKVKHALGNCYSHTGDTDKAIELLLEAAEEANNEAVTPLCWRDLAAMYEQQGKKEEAINLYERIKTEYPGCALVLSGEIDSQLAIIK